MRTIDIEKRLPFAHALSPLAQQLSFRENSDLFRIVVPELKKIETSYRKKFKDGSYAPWHQADILAEEIDSPLRSTVRFAATLITTQSPILAGWSETDKRYFLDIACEHDILRLESELDESNRNVAYYGEKAGKPFIAVGFLIQKIRELKEFKERLREKASPFSPQERK